MKADELAVRDSTLAVIRMKRREMEVIVSIRYLVENRGNSIFRNAQVDIEKWQFRFGNS